MVANVSVTFLNIDKYFAISSQTPVAIEYLNGDSNFMPFYIIINRM